MDVLTLAEADVDDWKSIKGCQLVALVVPRSRRDKFFGSAAWAALRPCLRYGVLVFVGPDHWYEIHPQALTTAMFKDESGCYVRYMGRPTDVGVYLDMNPGPVNRTVEVVRGWMFADVGADGRVLGVEVLL